MGFFDQIFLSPLQTILTLLTYMGFFDQIFLSLLQTILTLLTYMSFFDQFFFFTVTNHLNSSNLHEFFLTKFLSPLQPVEEIFFWGCEDFP